MSCEEFSESLSAYLDHELSPSERARLEAHLRDCSGCRQELESLRAVSRLVSSLPAVEPSEGFSRSLSREIAARRPRRWLRPIPLFAGDLVPVLAVAAVVLIVVTAALVIPYFTGPSPGPRGVEAPAGPAPTAERAKVSPPAEPSEPALAAAAPEEAPSGRPEVAPSAAGRLDLEAPAGERLAERSRREAAPALPPGRADGAADMAAPAAPAMSAAAKAAEQERVGGPAEKKAAVALARAPATAGFHTVVLQSTDIGAGQTAFRKALGEFDRLRTPTDLATVRPMSPEESRRYARLIKSLLDSPDVVTFTEMKVPASDLDLVKAVFADRAELTFAEPTTDVERLRRLLASARSRPRPRREARGAARERGSLGLSEPLRRAREEAEVQEYAGPERQLVDVVIVLKRRPAGRPAPTPNQPSGRRPR